MPTEPSRVRTALGFELRRARTAAGLTLRAFTADRGQAAAVAGRPPIPHPRLYRAERGTSTLTDEHLATFLALTDPPPETRSLIETLHASTLTETTRWSLALDDGAHLQDVAAGRERQAGRISVVEVAYLPGLLQTEAYARALFPHFDLPDHHDPAAAAAARLARAEVLYEPGREFRFVFPARCLTWDPAGGSAPLIGDAALNRIGSLSMLDTVEVRVLTDPRARLPMNGFTLFERVGGEGPESDYVVIELEHGESVIPEPGAVATYRAVFERLFAAARSFNAT